MSLKQAHSFWMALVDTAFGWHTITTRDEGRTRVFWAVSRDEYVGDWDFDSGVPHGNGAYVWGSLRVTVGSSGAQAIRRAGDRFEGQVSIFFLSVPKYCQ